MAKKAPEPVDEKLSEEDALARAKSEGIEFDDFFTIEGDENEKVYRTRAAAEKDAVKLGGKANIIQTRGRRV